MQAIEVSPICQKKMCETLQAGLPIFHAVSKALTDSTTSREFCSWLRSRAGQRLIPRAKKLRYDLFLKSGTCFCILRLHMTLKAKKLNFNFSHKEESESIKKELGHNFNLPLIKRVFECLECR